MKQTPIDEIYHFQCTCCGDCCTGNMEININVYDLYKIARRLKLPSTGDLFKKKLVELQQVQNNCWTPQLVFKTSPFVFCPWLINDMGDDDVLRGFCSLHSHDKPLICKMAPAGRVVDFDNGRVSYMLTPPTENCPGMEIQNVNKLSDLKKVLHMELQFEYRFYGILEILEKKQISKELMLDEFYSFSTNRDFSEILAELEDKSKLIILRPDTVQD